MGKLSDIPKLKAALAERTQRLRDERAGVSDAAAARMGLVTPRTEAEVYRDMVASAAAADYIPARYVPNPGSASHIASVIKAVPGVVSVTLSTSPVDDFEVIARVAVGARASTEKADDIRNRCQEVVDTVRPVGVRVTVCVTWERDTPEAADARLERDDRIQAAAMAAMSQGVADHSGMNCRNTPEEALTTQFGNENAALLAENERLTKRVAVLEAEIRRRTTRFNPCSMCEEPWDPIATLEEIGAQVPRDRRLGGYTLAGVVAEMGKLLAAAEARLSGLPANADPAECAALLGLQAVRVEPGMLLAIREPGPNGPVPLDALKRMGRALHSELAKRFGSMTYGAPIVLCIPHGATLETVLPQGRGAVQVNVQPEGHPKRPTDVPKHVASTYAEAAAASFGVTPEVVRRKRSERRAAEAVRLGLGPAPVEVGQYLRFRSLLARVESVYVRRDYRCWYLDLALCDADGMPLPEDGDNVNGLSGPASELLTQFVSKVLAPIPRREHRPIGRDIIAYDDPDDMLLADAPDGEG